jgi:hypothetical protein
LPYGARQEGRGGSFYHNICEKRFQMGPYNARLVRVFPRNTGAVITDIAFPSNATFEAIVECEAGRAIHDMGARYEIKIDVIDFSAMVTIVSSAILAFGFTGDENWPTLAQQFVFTIPEPGVANEGHIWKIFASLKVGVVNPCASLAESELFLINSP